LSFGCFIAKPSSGHGIEFSFMGIFGFLFFLKESVQFNVMGLVIGFDLIKPALFLPGIGRIDLNL
jgi:hypothetical protein